MNETIATLITFCVVFVIFAAHDWLKRKAIGEILEGAERREKALFAIIRSLENRLHAKDLSGYMALQSEDHKPTMGASPVAGDDAAEAEAEAVRAGIVDREYRGLMNGFNSPGDS